MPTEIFFSQQMSPIPSESDVRRVRPASQPLTDRLRLPRFVPEWSTRGLVSTLRRSGSFFDPGETIASSDLTAGPGLVTFSNPPFSWEGIVHEDDLVPRFGGGRPRPVFLRAAHFR